MVRQHHWLNGHELEQTLGDSEGQRSLVCCNPWDRKESDMTQRLNNDNKMAKRELITLTKSVLENGLKVLLLKIGKRHKTIYKKQTKIQTYTKVNMCKLKHDITFSTLMDQRL